MKPRAEAAAELERRIGHTFQDRELYERALTHASTAGMGKPVRHNQRLEFLGDRVLNLLAAERVMAMDAFAREGEMSRRVAALVNNRTCARVAREIGLGPALKLGEGGAKIGLRDSDNVLGDACEALMAAIYIDAGLPTARSFFHTFWAEEFAHLDGDQARDPKTGLQEWAQARGLPLPAYAIVSRSGPDHAPHFAVSVRVDGYPEEIGEGSSRQDAEKAAALAMLLNREGPP